MGRVVKYGSKEYGIMLERMGEKAKKPFKIEEFCAQVAWMGKKCPVYPHSLSESDADPCHFLISEEYDGYRCPVTNCLENFVPKIVKEGTEEQKKALENLADMYMLFSQRRDLHENVFLEEQDIDRPLCEAEEIYKQLGLKDKAKDCDEKMRALNLRPRITDVINP